jgi:hypothetical protein
MTPRERGDMPWILTALAVVVIVVIAGAIFRWA